MYLMFIASPERLNLNSSIRGGFLLHFFLKTVAKGPYFSQHLNCGIVLKLSYFSCVFKLDLQIHFHKNIPISAQYILRGAKVNSRLLAANQGWRCLVHDGMKKFEHSINSKYVKVLLCILLSLV